MTINIGIISVRGETYHPTRRLIEAAVQRQARVNVIHPYHLLPALVDGRALLGNDKHSPIIPGKETLSEGLDEIVIFSGRTAIVQVVPTDTGVAHANSIAVPFSI